MFTALIVGTVSGVKTHLHSLQVAYIRHAQRLVGQSSLHREAQKQKERCGRDVNSFFVLPQRNTLFSHKLLSFVSDEQKV